MSAEFHQNPEKVCLFAPQVDLPLPLNPFPQSLFSSYVKALLQKKKGMKRGESVPSFGLSASFHIDAQWFKEYLSICEWTSSSEYTDRLGIDCGVPLTVPQVYAAPLQTLLLTDKRCPVPILGVVHASNEMWGCKPVYIDTPYTLKVWFGQTRWKAKGFEFDLHTTLSDPQTQEIHWAARTSIFKRIPRSQFLSQDSKSPTMSSSSTSPKLLSEQETAQSLACDLSADLGRRYGKIARDRNPIHLYPWSARLFGFKKPIIHGMWTLARTLGRVCYAHECSLGSLHVRFKRPLALPSTCTLSSQYDPSLEVHSLEVLTSEKKVAIEGSIKPQKDSESDDLTL